MAAPPPRPAEMAAPPPRPAEEAAPPPARPDPVKSGVGGGEEVGAAEVEDIGGAGNAVGAAGFQGERDGLSEVVAEGRRGIEGDVERGTVGGRFVAPDGAGRLAGGTAPLRPEDGFRMVRRIAPGLLEKLYGPRRTLLNERAQRAYGGLWRE